MLVRLFLVKQIMLGIKLLVLLVLVLLGRRLFGPALLVSLLLELFRELRKYCSFKWFH
jgi:hypothetical protein